MLAACQALAITLTPNQLARLHQWHTAGRQLRLTLLPVLRTTESTLMARLQQTPALRPFLGELLAPTVAVWQGEQAAFLTALRKAGFIPDLDSSTGAPPAEPDRPAISLPTAEAALFWLAARYQRLGDFLPLLAPLPTAHLAALFDQLAPPEQAALHAQIAQLEEQLRTAFDQLPFTPPPQPTDPAVWRPLIIQAIDSQARLQMTYFTAGRNLTTSRLVEPYWLEEVRACRTCAPIAIAPARPHLPPGSH
ncbi:MAG: hypothetical protein R3C14_32265 [Caldilineaceae bacterium]